MTEPQQAIPATQAPGGRAPAGASAGQPGNSQPASGQPGNGQPGTAWTSSGRTADRKSQLFIADFTLKATTGPAEKAAARTLAPKITRSVDGICIL